jgi:hypothetical protein
VTADKTQQRADHGGQLGVGVAGSNLTEGKDIRLLCLLCRQQPLRSADRSSREVLPKMCLPASDRATSTMRLSTSDLRCCHIAKIQHCCNFDTPQTPADLQLMFGDTQCKIQDLYSTLSTSKGGERAANFCRSL